MSHFNMLVITPEEPNDEVLGKILQPWHEFECTGIDDEYVVDVDKTAEALEAYGKATETRLRGPDGTLHDRFNEKGEWKPEFSREEPDPHFPRLTRRVGYVPEGYEEVEVPANSVETAAEWISGYYAWSVVGPDSPPEEGKEGGV